VKGLFVIGTDTGVGKTAVATALLRLALRRGRRPVPFKPVETGADPEARDARALWEAAGRPVPLRAVCPFPFPLPAAPAAAAAAAGVTLAIAELVRLARDLAPDDGLIVVEAAGGLLVPYAGVCTCADLAAALGLPLLLVARTALGTINHTALTIAELARRGLALAGLILVQTQPEKLPHEDTNARLIEDLTGVQPLGTLPHLCPDDATQPDRLADALAAVLDPRDLEALLEGGLARQMLSGRLFG
jgi:dethiobiotin synthetase